MLINGFNDCKEFTNKNDGLDFKGIFGMSRLSFLVYQLIKKITGVDKMATKKNKNLIKMTKQSDMTYEELEEKYLRKCKVNNLSENTIKTYKTISSIFKKYLNNPDIKANEIDENMLDEYILHLKDTSVKDVSINTYLLNISPILRYGMDLGIIETFKIRGIRADETIKQIYTDEELEILLKKPDMNKISFAKYRNWIIVNFLFGTGIRAKELRSLRIKDLDLHSSMLLVSKTKNRKQRYIPIGKYLNNLMVEYVIYRKANNDDDYLFSNIYGEQLARTTLQLGITNYCKKRGIDKYSLHLFRHTFASKWVINRGDPFQLQRILGHSSMKMTNRYVNLYGHELKKNYESYNPLELMNKNKDRIKYKKQ